MTDSDEPQYRAYHRATPDRVSLREEGDGEEGVFRVRMPIATTGEVRNQGDDPLTRDELEGMAQQIDERAVSVFGDHGKNPDLAGSRYSAFEALGEWEDPDVQSREGDEGELVATARLMDPDTMSESTGMLREGLARLKAQVDRDLSLSSSIGWRDDDAYPGGVDLMETSIVGIGADPRTTSAATPAAQARAVVMGANTPDADDVRHLSSQQAEMATQVLDAYRDGQGNGSVDNFESWLWSARSQFDEGMIHATMTALQEFYRDNTPLEEPVSEQLAPFLEGRQGDNESTNNMTDDTTESGDAGDGVDPDGTHDDGSDDIDAGEFRSQMLEMQRSQTETLSTLADAIREGSEDDGDEDDEDDDDEDDGGENDADGTDGERTVTLDGEERSVDDAIADLQEQAAEAEPAESQTTNYTDDESDDGDKTAFGFAGAE